MSRRRGFTLLEVVLATGIAVLLLGALYVAVDMQLRLAQQARDLVQESTLSRALFDRMDSDGSHVVGLCDPARFRLAAGADAGTTTGVVVPLGVMGDSETLHLFISRLPREALVQLNNTDAAPPVVSDLRRVSYWLVGGDGSPAGLGRQEVPLITSDDALQNLPPGIDNESSYVLADEVRSLSFQYFDGTDWQDSWDSTMSGADGVTPIGSPRAVAVTIGIARAASPGSPQGGDADVKTYRHVLVISSANGTTAMSQAATGTTGTGTTGSGAAP